MSSHKSNWTQVIKFINLDNEPLSNRVFRSAHWICLNILLKLSFKFLDSKPEANQGRVPNLQGKAQTDPSSRLSARVRVLLLPAAPCAFRGHRRYRSAFCAVGSRRRTVTRLWRNPTQRPRICSTRRLKHLGTEG